MYNVYLNNIDNKLKEYGNESWDLNPFGHLVIDNFMPEELAETLYGEAVDLIENNQEIWNSYNNPLEKKFVFNKWDRLPKSVYSFFLALGDKIVTEHMERISGIDNLVADSGLHGGGIHMHKNGGKLNVHQDYSIHPKTELQRRLNIIFYIAKDWNPEWGGGLGLYHDDAERDEPTDLEKVVDCIWNRAVIFDTAPGSWHGLPDPIECPENMLRLSLAYYYIRTPVENAPIRGAVRFAPSEDQKGDSEIENLIKLRSNPETAKNFYGQK